ncbi:helix-turn-helix domain-containing protein [Actinomadura barringtoniae]|uniref:Helix-turn-helix domain-containing protein n=1 Tax=Actinomadura barringtoniae TaxID=1427535 RepID=A0A939TDH6_9ACTN|nr:helix-turn-helix transcriptional regulator [Actinomadura barringtoniae]MBO2455602.1 helix-turn-helix domain-containing protein [Actinomadura barringtoniae]
MAHENWPSVRFRRIGRTLRELREEANRSLRTAGRDLDRSPSNLSMIENGLQPIRPRDLAPILTYYGVHDGPLRESLIHLAAQGREKDWTSAYQGRISPAGQDLASLERDSGRICSFQPGRVPGLLQTEVSARDVITAGPANPSLDVEGLVAFRMDRQRVLSQPDLPRFETVVGESALRQKVGGPAAMREQLLHLVSQSRYDHISLRVLPYSAGGLAWYSTSFDILDLRPPGRLTVVVLENFTHMSFREKDDEVAEFQKFFAHVWKIALDEARSLDLIEEIASET